MIEIPKAYEPQSVESKWYEFWDQNGCFTADPARVSDARPAYSIVIPPPNVTGVLTLGHVLNNTIQDILARKARMDGKEVLWLPGTDHAGIATQNVVEKTLKKAGEIKHRDDLGREALVARIWEWKEKYGGIILKQLRALGASCDWTRTRFTMDPEYSRCVQKVFVDLYKKGLIYRGKRMVNWCPASLTALSDEEVTMKEQKGFMYHFRVQVVEADGSPLKMSGGPLTPSLSPTGGEGARRAGEGDASTGGPINDAEGNVFLTIATTRPETIPADTAVAVNPKDPRYAHLVGKHVVKALPLDVPKELRVIPIIADEHVDFEFGTGVLKVTPAHDKADFEIGLRHQLPVIDILTPDGKMMPEAGADLAGLDRFVARKKAAELMEAAGSLDKAEPYTNNVGFSERADVPIEPRLSEQWFLKYPSVESSTKCVATGEMKFFPDRWAKVYDHWMGGIQDWCISRQLWWGHRIPVWKLPLNASGDSVANQLKDYFAEWQINEEVLIEVHQTAPEFGDVIRFLVSGEKAETAARKLNSFYQFGQFDASLQDGFPTARAKELAYSIMASQASDQATQDSDVLDTWFSSWLWPFATMGWTDDKETDSQNPTLKAFYPTTDLVTGPDIIFFWVARMIMAGYEWMGDLPFRNVYFTGIIRDKQGRKMSKSLGNSPDPLDLIAQYGADALRFGVMRTAPLGQDVLFDEQTVELGRNFCNKLWNACRFRQMQGGGAAAAASSGEIQSAEVPAGPVFEVCGEIDPLLLTSDDKWILLRLDQAIREVTQAFTDYKFSDATSTLYRFFWSEYCDWYVEASKAAFYGTDDTLKANKLAVIDFVLGHLLRVFHPFLPFITEELWHGMGFSKDMPEAQGGKTIMFAAWPKPFTDDEKSYFQLDDAADKVAQAKYDLVLLGRTLKRDCNIDPAKRVKFILRPAGDLPAAEVSVLRILLNAESLDVVDAAWQPEKGTPVRANSLGELFLPLTGLIDFAAERVRLSKEVEKIAAEIEKVQAKLANPSFAQKVPAKVLEEHQLRLADWQTKEAQAKASLANLPE
jgi:valyl-tRNA synthetase